MEKRISQAEQIRRIEFGVSDSDPRVSIIFFDGSSLSLDESDLVSNFAGASTTRTRATPGAPLREGNDDD
jgi:hypothetical protein